MVAAVGLAHLRGPAAGDAAAVLAVDLQERGHARDRGLDPGELLLLVVQPLEPLRELADQVGIERRQALLQDLREGLRIEPLGQVGPAELEQEVAQRREAVLAQAEDLGVELLAVVPAGVEDPALARRSAAGAGP